MTIMHSVARTGLAFVGCLLLGTSLAFAQATRTWVSGVGDDVNPCSRTAPCKTFAGAISKTAAGGEISVLDPGGYGAVTITKSITINGNSEHASILAAGTNGINVSAAGVIVQLRNLQLNGAGLTPSPGLVGIRILPGATGATLIIDDVFVHGFQTGIQVEAGNAIVNQSVIASNSAYGVRALAGTLTIENSLLTNNEVAVRADGAGVIRMSNNGVYNNRTGFGCGGTLASAGNNRKAGNVGGVVPVCVPTVGITLQ
jgi:hypothetical protein